MYMSASENTRKLRELFKETSSQHNLRGILGVTPFESVYESLLLVQKKRLKEITGMHYDEFIEKGFFVSIAYVYPNGIIDNIGIINEGVLDKDAWNIYAKWYQYLNNSLNLASQTIADRLDGIAIKATSTGMVLRVESVKEYFPTVVSHRVHAEQSGIGWRGKNNLVINPVYSCMIRLAGVVTTVPLHVTKKTDDSCESCDHCLQACTFLKHKDKLDDYREQCLAFMNGLALDGEVCGKCIKACVYSQKFEVNNRPPSIFDLNSVFYTTR
jgi:epoxyqueuosine reductase QueG